ncbi:MAG: leucine efflux protein LeuE [Castellaniella sp.]|uniref:leucine efflux protein LeuE n=1 Tax=Castellaniella sp. TaxID=1955812 RepID=UPI0012025085|nr:leucine efflux protein LeuE [Castellaniella sp.]TAN27391.1 MAG: leucine efflux protein LeuE [Castellaniella sp.]
MFAHYGVINLWTYVAGVVFIILLPGPNSLFVLATGASRGVRAGYQAAFGVFLGDSILMTLTAAGAASVLQLLPVLYLVLKTAGALYLCYLGIHLLRSAWRPGPARAQVVSGGTDGRFRKALLLSLLNPKAILFLLSFFVQFVDPHYTHPALSFFILAAILQTCSILYLSVLIFGGTRLAAFFRRRQMLARTGSGLVGLLFLGFAGMMVFEE